MRRMFAFLQVRILESLHYLLRFVSLYAEQTVTVKSTHLRLLNHLLHIYSCFRISVCVGLLGRGVKSESVLTDPNAIPQHHIVAESAVTERRVARYPAVASDHHIWADHTVAFYRGSLLDVDASKNYRVSPNVSRFVHARTGIDQGSAMQRPGIQKRGYSAPSTAVRRHAPMCLLLWHKDAQGEHRWEPTDLAM